MPKDKDRDLIDKMNRALTEELQEMLEKVITVKLKPISETLSSLQKDINALKKEQKIQEFEVPQKSPLSPLRPSPKKLSNKIIVIILLIIVAPIVGYGALNREKQQQVSNDVSQKIVNPLTIRPLMPIVEMDQQSTSYKNSITQIQFYEVSQEAQKQLNDIILRSDSEIKSRKVNNPDSLFNILYTNDDKSFVLYVMTPTGESCIPSGMKGFDCYNAKLKILNTKDNSINLLTNNFGDVYLSEKDNLIIVFNGSNYEIFNLSKPYSLRKSTPSGFSSLLINEYSISYNKTTYNFVIENILTNKKISCVINNTGVKNTLKNNFDLSHFSLSPNGNKIIIFGDNNKFIWDDLSNQWSANSPDCLNNTKEAERSSVSRMGEWYGNSNYFAYSNYGSDTFIYDFNSQKQIFFMPWDGTDGVGDRNNYGYKNLADLNYEGYRIQTVPNIDKVDIYIINKNGEKYLINSYTGKSVYYQYNPSPTNWVRFQQDTKNLNQFHLLVLDGYNIRQALDISIQP